MPVRKFHSVAEEDQPKRHEPGTVEFSRALRAVFWIAATFAPPRIVPPGVHKFGNIEEAQARKKSWQAARTER